MSANRAEANVVVSMDITALETNVWNPCQLLTRLRLRSPLSSRLWRSPSATGQIGAQRKRWLWANAPECLAHSIVMTGLTGVGEYLCKLLTRGKPTPHFRLDCNSGKASRQGSSAMSRVAASPSAGALVLAALTARSNRKPQTQRSHAKERQTSEPLVSGRPRPAVAMSQNDSRILGCFPFCMVRRRRRAARKADCAPRDQNQQVQKLAGFRHSRLKLCLCSSTSNAVALNLKRDRGCRRPRAGFAGSADSSRCR